MSTISVIYIFYISLGGIIILLSYKMFMICKSYPVKKSDFSDRVFFTDICQQISVKVHTMMSFAKKVIISPAYTCVNHNIKLTCRGCARFINDIRSGREKPDTIIEKNGTASAYMEDILKQKKSIQKKNHKVIHSENL